MGATAVRTRRGLMVLLIVAAVLVALRIALPYWGVHYLNGKLDRMGDYRGHMAEIDLALWRGAYVIHELDIVKVDGKVPVPLLKAPRIDLAISWNKLFHGALVGRVVFDSPQVNFVDSGGSGESGDEEQAEQAGQGVDWRQTLQELFPMELDEVRVVDGEVHFRNFSSQPKVDVYLRDLDATVTNLTNADRRKGAQIARLHATGSMLDDAPLEMDLSFDPLGKVDDFEFRGKLSNIDLPKLNDFAKAYGRIDIESGRGEIVSELQARERRLSGYVKPLFTDVKIVDWQTDIEEPMQHGNPIRPLWESAVAAVTELLSNQRQDQFATRIPISGSLDESQVGTLPAVLSILRNAFVSALKPRFEGLTDDD